MKKYFFIILLGIVALTGAGLVFLATSRWGVNLEGDGTLFILTARLLENAHAYKDLLAWCLGNIQPLYPLTLTWWHLWGISHLEGARLFVSLLFGLNILLIGIITKKYTRSSWLGLCASLLMLSAPDILEMHLTAQSEPLFILFLLVWLLLLFNYLEKPRLATLFFASIIVTLASLTRFAGIPMLLTGLLAVVFLNRGQILRDKIIHALVLVSFPCMALLMGYIENNTYHRIFAFHPVNAYYFQNMAHVFCNWFLPQHVLVLAKRKVLFLAMGIILGLIWLCRRNSDCDKFFIMGVIFIFIYVMSLVFGASFFDAGMSPFEMINRYLIIVHVLGIILCIGLLFKFYQDDSFPYKNYIVIIFVLYFVSFYIFGSAKNLMHQYILGDEYPMNPIKFSYTMRVVKTMPAGILIYSNKARDVFIWSDKIAYPTPIKENRFSLLENTGYLKQFSDMIVQLRETRGILVYFAYTSTEYNESLRHLQKIAPLHLIAQDKYASIFNVP